MDKEMQTELPYWKGPNMELNQNLFRDMEKVLKEGKKFLVTGASGLVGSAFVRLVTSWDQFLKYKDQFKFLSSKDGDLMDTEAVNKIFNEFKPTYVLHLAAMVGGLFHNMANNLDFFRSNMAMNDNVLQACVKVGVVKCVSCLSTCIFPNKTTYPIDETMIHDGPPHGSNFGYSFAKRMIDVQNLAIYEKYNLKYTAVIPCNVYGDNDNYNLQKSHVIPGLIHKFYLAKKNNTDAVVMGTGTPLRQFINSKDLATCLLWALMQYDEVDPVILAHETEISILDVAKTIAEALELPNPVVCDPSKADGQFKKTACTKKFRAYSPLTHSFIFREIHHGIADATRWFVKNYDIARK